MFTEIALSDTFTWHFVTMKVKVKVNFSLEEAEKAQKGSIVLLFLYPRR